MSRWIDVRGRVGAGFVGRLGALLLLAFCLCGCLYLLGPAAAAEPREAPQVQLYTGTWEYRWGDSPTTPSGQLRWAQTGSGDSGWQADAVPYKAPPGRDGANFLWLRTRLDGPPLAEPTLYTAGLDQLFEAYVDGRLVYRFGDFSGPLALHFVGYPAHLIPLGSGYAGKWLTLRIYSDDSRIGMLDPPLLGGRGDITTLAFRRDIGRLCIGSLLAVLGLAVLSLFLLRLEERAYLNYGGFALCVGIYIISVARVRNLLWSSPVTWTYIELLSLYSLPIFLVAYLEQMFGRDQLGIARWLWRMHILLLVQAAIRMLLGERPYATLLPFQIAVIADSLYLSVMICRAAVRGDRDARIVSVGFIIAAVLAIIDVLRAMGVLPRYWQSTSHYGNAALALSLGLISARRYMLLHIRLGNYFTVLQLSLDSAHTLDPAQQARVALDELLRMLEARRALLFARQDDGGGLSFLSGRDSSGTDVVDGYSFDAEIFAQAQQRRRPVTVHRAAAGGLPARSLMATPLLLRGELLGVLCLEAERSRRAFQEQDQEISMGLGSQLASAIMTTRATRLNFERELTRRQIEQQQELLRAAARMASGDLDTAIVVPSTSELSALATALDGMRQDLRHKIGMLDQMQQDLRAKVDALQSRNQEVGQLNDELRRQIEHRSRRLLEVLPEAGALPITGRLQPGALLGDCYRVVRTIGQGGMGVVYEVERTTDGRRLALKLLGQNPDRTAVSRFVREAQILARLNHPNLISICDVDITRDGILFIAMELVSGCSLWELRLRFGQVGWALTVLRQIAAALSALHALGIVHRDLKPENVLLTRREQEEPEQVKLADFGIAILLDERPTARRDVAADPAASAVATGLTTAGQGGALSPVADALLTLRHTTTQDELEDQQTLQRPAARPPPPAAAPSAPEERTRRTDRLLTQTGVIVGTPLYMAPELSCGSRDAQPSSDVFSMGVIAFELLTGSLPFDRPLVLQRSLAALHIPPLLAHCPSLDPAIAQQLERCLAMDPALRPSAEQVAAALKSKPAGLGPPNRPARS